MNVNGSLKNEDKKNFEKLNKDRYVEFVVGSYNEAFNERNLPFLYIEGIDRRNYSLTIQLLKNTKIKLFYPQLLTKQLLHLITS